MSYLLKFWHCPRLNHWRMINCKYLRILCRFNEIILTDYWSCLTNTKQYKSLKNIWKWIFSKDHSVSYVIPTSSLFLGFPAKKGKHETLIRSFVSPSHFAVGFKILIYEFCSTLYIVWGIIGKRLSWRNYQYFCIILNSFVEKIFWEICWKRLSLSLFRKQRDLKRCHIHAYLKTRTKLCWFLEICNIPLQLLEFVICLIHRVSHFLCIWMVALLLLKVHKWTIYNTGLLF